MQTVNIKYIDIVCLYGGHQPERREHIESLFKNKELRGEIFMGVSDKGTRSGAYGIIKCLETRIDNFKPFIFIEDDVSATPWYRDIINIPLDADALYLGISTWGVVRDGREHTPYSHIAMQNIIKTKVSDDIFRVYNMLTTHAILINSKKWLENCITCFKYALEHQEGRYYDVPLAFTMHKFNVYCLKEPIFYQDLKVGGTEDSTLVVFED
jgi:hypothetical protein